MSTELPPAAWYPDPSESGFIRYWDGRAWTEHRSAVSGDTRFAPAGRRTDRKATAAGIARLVPSEPKNDLVAGALRRCIGRGLPGRLGSGGLATAAGVRIIPTGHPLLPPRHHALRRSSACTSTSRRHSRQTSRSRDGGSRSAKRLATWRGPAAGWSSAGHCCQQWSGRSSRQSNGASACSGGWAGVLGGLAWAVATFLVVPVLALAEEVGPIEALKRSSHLIRTTFGTIARGALRFGMLFLGWILLALAW